MTRWIPPAVLAILLVGAAEGGFRAGGEPGSKPKHEPAAADRRTRSLAKEFQRDVEILAADSMEGRGLGTAGIGRAADWIESELRRRGLQPVFDGSFRQSFKVKMGVSMAKGNRLDGVPDADWATLGFSSTGEFSGPLAFAGYGIESPALGFEELKGLDLKGKVVLMLRYEPQEKDDASPFAGKKPSRWSGLRYKVLQARERGAAAVIFATGPLQDEGQDKVPALKNDGPESPAGIPVLQVKTSVAQKWLDRAKMDLKTFQETVDRDLVPRSVDAVGIDVAGRVALDATYAETANVAGKLPGRGSLAQDVVVIGAHYDHLGMGGERSMRPNETAIHNGADDNASGVVAALQIGTELRKLLETARERRTVVVALFSGEEVGLAGSSYFVDHPPFPLMRTIAMINLDMVGRLRDNLLAALGSDSAPEWKAEIDRARQAAGLEVTAHGDGYGPSDQTSFYASGVPVLHLFTGAHEQYHTPDDDASTLDAEGAARITEFAVELARHLSQEPIRLTYNKSGSAPFSSGDSRGYGAYLGTVPDYRAMEATEGGVLLADVRKDGPADRAGIRGGDRIVEMAGTRIENLYDMTYALQDHKPGETITVVVVRQDKPSTFRATLGDRAAMTKEPAPAASPGTPAPAASTAAKPAAPAAESAPSKSALPAAPGSPASAHDTPTPSAEGAVASFYEGRPGPDFQVGAGKPYGKIVEGERHLKEIRQLTFGGENAEPYFAPDGRQVIFQATPPGGGCDQEFILDLATGAIRRISSGKGRTTCGYWDWPEADRVVYSTTEGAGASCPPPPDHSQGYVWALYDSYDIVEAKPDGSGVRRLTETPGYDAEATWCHRGGKLIFTSDRNGDLDLYVMDEAGETKRMTHEEGYDGGAFFSPDCSEIVWRASRPQGPELEEYRQLLKKGLIRPHSLEIYMMKADGTGARPLTSNGAANFCPTFTADGNRILFSSNMGPGGKREFDLYLVGRNGGEPERITFSPGFDGFPHFSPDGRWLIWSSNRADPASHETNLFIARWAD
ncbi:MAG TPA: M28 family peptidase [Candidatus Polarisedimenticolia bacterium]|jgi:Tol biopolymer transport system component|nr:M28 family peptidase [Candidatus Polarisedimenticolia bacterium]